MNVKELVEAIAEAKKEGLHEIVEKLKRKLDTLLDEDSSPQPAAKPSSWIDIAPEVGRDSEGRPIHIPALGEARVPASDLPKRSAREIRMASDYFDEGTKLYAEDEERLHEMFEGAEFVQEKPE